MDQLMELFKQMQELAGVGMDMLHGAKGGQHAGGPGGAPDHQGGAPAPAHGAPNPDAAGDGGAPPQGAPKPPPPGQ